MLYNRARVLILDYSVPIRDTEAAKQRYSMFEAIGGKYSGYQSIRVDQGPSPAHFYLFDDPSEETLAMLIDSMNSEPFLKIKIIREFKGCESMEYTIENIVKDIATVLNPTSDEKEIPSSESLARCWSGVKVLEILSKL